MTTEDDFQAALDANPDDWQTRLVFADWLEERGDPRAAYFRLAGEQRWRPELTSATGYPDAALKRAGVTSDRLWRYYNADCITMVPHRLPFDIGHGNWLHSTRRKAEDAAALAFAQLPADHRHELLANPSGATKAKRRRKK